MVRAGGWPAKAPLGYKNVGSARDREIRSVVVDPTSAPEVRKLFELCATGEHSLTSLTEHAERFGLRTYIGLKLPTKNISRMLRNMFYIGEVHWQGIVAKGVHEPLVTVEVFDAAQRVLSGHHLRHSRNQKHNFPLRGFLFCAACGKRLVGELQSKKQKEYYRCHTRGGCQPGLHVETAETHVSEFFAHLSVPQAFCDTVLQHFPTQRKNLTELFAFIPTLSTIYSRAFAHTRRLLLTFAWEQLVTENASIVKGIPTLLFQAAGIEAVVRETQKPVLKGRAFVQKGVHHPTQSSLDSEKVLTRARWGLSQRLIRLQIRAKIAPWYKMPSEEALTRFLMNTTYLNHMTMLLQEIQVPFASSPASS